MIGIIFAIVAGAAMSIQGVMNTRLGDKIGVYESNVWVQGTAFLLSLLVLWILGKGSFRGIFSVNKFYLLGGVFGILITLTVMMSIKNLSPTVAISIILIAQLTVAGIIDAFGLMESEKITFSLTKISGLVLMIAGTILFKLKG